MTKWLSRFALLLVALAIGAAIAGPIGPVPGVRIGGTPTPVPADWSTFQLPEEVKLRTTGGLLPRVVTIWIVEANSALYVFGANDSGWVNATLKDPAVQLRIDDRTYALTATQVPDLDPVVYKKYIDRYATNYPDIVASMPEPDASEDAFASAGVAFKLQAPL